MSKVPMRRPGAFFSSVALSVAALNVCAYPAPARAVVAYVFPQNNALQPGQIDARRLTRINYAFANIVDGRMVTGFPRDEENFAFLQSLKRENPSLTVLVSVGGWLWSTNFSEMALTTQSRTVFIQSVMDFLERFNLDGLDIDWEYPGLPGSGHPFRKEDKQNFTVLLKELHARFAKETAKTRKPLFLTIAAGAGEEYLANTEMGKVAKYVDTVNLMAYDYYEPGSDAVTGNHAPLFTNPADPKKISAAESVTALEKAGVPARKIVLGMPFYGHMWGQVPDLNQGLFQQGKPIPNAFAPYSAIVANMLNQGYTRYWDDKASVPYLYNAEKQIFVSYEDPQSIAAKCRYVAAHDLGGAMFWEYFNDPSGTLLQAIDDSLGELSPKSATKP
jgi:chitinase